VRQLGGQAECVAVQTLQQAAAHAKGHTLHKQGTRKAAAMNLAACQQKHSLLDLDGLTNGASGCRPQATVPVHHQQTEMGIEATTTSTWPPNLLGYKKRNCLLQITSAL
jgi:hypothetical protein